MPRAAGVVGIAATQAGVDAKGIEILVVYLRTGDENRDFDSLVAVEETVFHGRREFPCLERHSGLAGIERNQSFAVAPRDPRIDRLPIHLGRELVTKGDRQAVGIEGQVGDRLPILHHRFHGQVLREGAGFDAPRLVFELDTHWFAEGVLHDFLSAIEVGGMDLGNIDHRRQFSIDRIEGGEHRHNLGFCRLAVDHDARGILGDRNIGAVHHHLGVDRWIVDVAIDPIEPAVHDIEIDRCLERHDLVAVQDVVGEGKARGGVLLASQLLGLLDGRLEVEAGPELGECGGPCLPVVGEGDRALLELGGALGEARFGLVDREAANVHIAHHHGGINLVVIHVAEHEEPDGRHQQDANQPNQRRGDKSKQAMRKGAFGCGRWGGWPIPASVAAR